MKRPKKQLDPIIFDVVMKRMALTLFLIISFLSSIIILNHFTNSVAAQTYSIITIKPDGSVEGTEKIQRQGDTYTFTADIFGSIVVQRSGITIDGANSTIQGMGNGVGIEVNGRSNVMIKKMTIANFSNGISIYESNDETISGNYIANNKIGIAIYTGSPRISVIGNHIENNEMGISLGGLDLKIYHNNFVNNTQQVYDSSWHPLNLAVPVVTHVWDDGKQGNFWSDHNATDADNNGIADTPYVLDQWSNNIDRYPLTSPLDIGDNAIVSPEPFPILLIVAIGVTVVAVACAGLLVYFKKREHKTGVEK